MWILYEEAICQFWRMAFSLIPPASADSGFFLFRELWDGRPLRLIGVFTSKAEQSEYEQLDLFQTARNEKQEKLDKACLLYTSRCV